MVANNADSRDFLPSATETKVHSKLPRYFWIWAPMLFVFCFSILFIFSYLQRRATVTAIRNQYEFITSSLNEFGLDIAYDHIEFNALWPYKLVKAENFKIYTLSADDYKEWSVKELAIDSGFFTSKKLNILPARKQNLQIGEDNYKISARRSDISMEISTQGLNNLIVKLYDYDISNIADIGEFSFAARKISSQQINDEAPFLKTFIDIHNIKLNGLLNYPLSQDISRIYFNGEIIGNFKKAEDIQASLNDWLFRNGRIEVKALTVNWMPLLLVGKGSIYFNEKFKPIVKLNTTSKALLDLINQLDTKNYLDNKGVFVTKILLGNKAYKANPEDKYLTVSTPIDYQDGEITIEKISVYKDK